MKKYIHLLILSAITGPVFSQNISDQKTINTAPIGSVVMPPAFNFSTDAEKVIAEMMELVSLKPNFIVKPGKVENAAASVRHGKRFIEYNPDFINDMNRKGISKWTYIFILAHEVGHHLNGHTLLKGKKILTAELEADEFAGFLLQMMGATLLQARMAVNHISNPITTKTHPGAADRIDAMVKGWTRANQQ